MPATKDTVQTETPTPLPPTPTPLPPTPTPLPSTFENQLIITINIGKDLKASHYNYNSGNRTFAFTNSTVMVPSYVINVDTTGEDIVTQTTTGIKLDLTNVTGVNGSPGTLPSFTINYYGKGVPKFTQTNSVYGVVTTPPKKNSEIKEGNDITISGWFFPLQESKKKPTPLYKIYNNKTSNYPVDPAYTDFSKIILKFPNPFTYVIDLANLSPSIVSTKSKSYALPSVHISFQPPPTPYNPQP